MKGQLLLKAENFSRSKHSGKLGKQKSCSRQAGGKAQQRTLARGKSENVLQPLASRSKVMEPPSQLASAGEGI